MLKKLTDEQLHSKLVDAVKEEKRLLTLILHLLREIDARKVFSDFKCSSLFEYATKILHYSEAEAYVRINAMKLMREIPEIENSLQTGELSLTNIAQAQTYFKKEDRQRLQTKLQSPPKIFRPEGLPLQISVSENTHVDHTKCNSNTFTENRSNKMKLTEKIEIVNQLKNCSTRQAQRVLLKMSPDRRLYSESVKVLDPETVELKFPLSNENFEKLVNIKGLLVHEKGVMNYEELIAILCEKTLELLKNKDRISSVKMKNSVKMKKSEGDKTAEPESQRHFRSVQINKTVTPRMKLSIKNRDQFQCVNCKSSFDLQIDHIHPKGLGGNNHPTNLQTLCRSCNLRRAVKSYGVRR